MIGMNNGCPLRWPAGFRCPQHLLVIAGTIFHDTRKPLRLWFEAMWHITSQKYGTNALGLQRVLSFGSYHTAWKWLHRLRRAMVRPDRDKLYGTIEVDETYIGGERSGKRGRGAENKRNCRRKVFLRAKNSPFHPNSIDKYSIPERKPWVRGLVLSFSTASRINQPCTWA